MPKEQRKIKKRIWWLFLLISRLQDFMLNLPRSLIWTRPMKIMWKMINAHVVTIYFLKKELRFQWIAMQVSLLPLGQDLRFIMSSLKASFNFYLFWASLFRWFVLFWVFHKLFLQNTFLWWNHRNLNPI